MRKFLSILMLACLLCGLALPAGAEEAGTPVQLYVKDGASDNYLTDITMSEGFSRTVVLYTKNEGDTYTPVSEGTPSVTGRATLGDGGTLSNCTVKAGKQGTAQISVNDGSTQYKPVDVTIRPSTLQIRKAHTEDEWATSLSGIQAGGSLDVKFRLVGAENAAISYEGAIGVPPNSGLTYSGSTLTASTAGSYTLRSIYSGTVTVKVDSTDLPADGLNTAEALNAALANKEELAKRFPAVNTSNSITLVLPATTYADQIKVGNLDGINLTLKGAEGQKTVMSGGIEINDSNVTLDGIAFTGSPAIILQNTVSQCAVSNCKFSGMPFKIQTKSKENGGISAPELVLTSNTYTGTTIELAKVVDPNGKECIWVADPKAAPTTTVLNLGVAISEYISGSTLQALSFDVDYSVDGLLENKWGLNLLLPCGFESAYTVCNGEKGLGEKATKYSGYYKVNVSEAGKYAVIDGSYPQLQDGKVIIREVDAAFLREVTVDTTYTNAVVKLGTKQVPSSINNKKLTFQLDKAGTYTVTATTTATTKSTTKTTTTTSRSYNYKYQDYYLITPQRVTDCMRYAKDNLVTIECKEAGRRSISLPVASMAAAAEKGYSILLKNEKIADITMDPAALKSLAQQAKGTTVLLHYRSLNHKTLTTVGLASVQSHLDQFPNDNADLAFLVTATSDSETIEDLQLGTITLRIPFIVLPGTEEMKNEVYALQTETAASARETTVADGHLTTKLTDLTEHMVFQIGEPVETTEETTEPTVETTVETTQPETVPETTAAPEPVEEEKGFPIWIPIVAVLLLGGGGAAAWFLYLRKRFQK
ncbi:MAG: hypothetical protein MSH58_07895 [Clostridiales bacterium]|nr:hypothetical protein [Clostridiales bacterium]